MVAGRIKIQQLRQIDLTGYEHVKVRQEIVTTGYTQGLFPVERDRRDVVIGIEKIDILKSAPTSAPVDAECSQISCRGVRVYETDSKLPGETDVRREARQNPVRASRPI